MHCMFMTTGRHTLCSLFVACPGRERNPSRTQKLLWPTGGRTVWIWGHKEAQYCWGQSMVQGLIPEEGAWLWFVLCAFIHSGHRTSFLLWSIRRIHPILFFIMIWWVSGDRGNMVVQMHWIFSCQPWTTSISQEPAVFRKTLEHPSLYNPSPRTIFPFRTRILI